MPRSISSEIFWFRTTTGSYEGDLPGDGRRLGLELIVVDDEGDGAALLEVLGGDSAAGQHHVAQDGLGQDAARVARPADGADLDLGQPEARAPARHHDVAQRRHEQAEPDRRPVHRHDDRDRDVEQRGLRVAHAHGALAGHVVRRTGAAVVEVEAGAEDVGQAAAPHRDEDVGIVGGALQLLGERFEEVEAERVDARARDREGRDPAALLHRERLVHRNPSPSRDGARLLVAASARAAPRRIVAMRARHCTGARPARGTRRALLHPIQIDSGFTDGYSLWMKTRALRMLRRFPNVPRLRVWPGRLSRLPPWVTLAVLATAGVAAVMLVPPRIAPELADPQAQFEVLDRARLTIALIFGGLVALVGVYMNWRRVNALEQQVATAQLGQITERFTRAIDQLGAVRPDNTPAPEIRAGGVRSLERIAGESPEDFWPILDILSAYLRSESPTPSPWTTITTPWSNWWRRPTGLATGWTWPSPLMQSADSGLTAGSR